MRHAAALALALALAGCYRPAADVACATTCPCPDGLECGPDNVCRTPGMPACTTIDAALHDAPGDGPIVPGDAACYGNLLGVRICTPAGGPRTFPAERSAISTDSSCDVIMPQAGGQGPQLCVVVGTTITFTAPVAVTGSRALVLFATNDITVGMGASIDASSNPNGVGPAADDIACAVTAGGAAQTDTTMDGGGGGAGGSFRGSGGDGGGGVKPNGGLHHSEPTPTYVRAGCRGGKGGDGLSASNTGGVGGHSGGAIYLLAGSTITVSGSINASGAGGAGAVASTAGGGGGGGAGGLIALDAPFYSVSGLILASGGGGGGGADPLVFATPGAGQAPASIAAATGGSHTGNAGSGGNGSSRVATDGVQGSSSGLDGPPSTGTGGGGGGGGAGHILVSPPGHNLGDTNIAPTTE